MARCSAAPILASPPWTPPWALGPGATGSELPHHSHLCDLNLARPRGSLYGPLVPYARGELFPLVADLLSTIMVVLSATMGLTVLLYSFGDIDRRREQGGYYPLFHLLLMGINGSFLTGDLFNLFVFFEVMLIASYVLLSLGGEPS
jgi:multicomponent Na+:H+ antiporter subunit D